MIGKKCYLSPMTAGDAEQFTGWLNDVELTVHLQLYNGVINLENERAYLSGAANDHNYSIIAMETDKVIGNCGFLDIDHVNQTAETGIFIGDKNYLNKGYGTEALTLLADYGFKALNLHNIMLKVYGFNKRAVRAYEKAGFQYIGTRRQALHRNLQKHDIIFMDLLENEFYEKNLAFKASDPR